MTRLRAAGRRSEAIRRGVRRSCSKVRPSGSGLGFRIWETSPKSLRATHSVPCQVRPFPPLLGQIKPSLPGSVGGFRPKAVVSSDPPLQQLALADEASEPGHTPRYGTATIVKRHPATLTQLSICEFRRNRLWEHVMVFVPQRREPRQKSGVPDDQVGPRHKRELKA
jgi:hypothetical protein